jgi:hypothetical protein
MDGNDGHGHLSTLCEFAGGRIVAACVANGGSG